MSKTIEEAATRYAEEHRIPNSPITLRKTVNQNHIADAFADGADFALSHLWRSVEDGLSELEENECVIIRTKRDGKFKVAYFDRQCYEFDVKVGSNSCEIYRHTEITHFMPIPSLNLEQR